MRGAVIHGVLLAVMLVYGYRTWTRDKTTQPDHGSVVLWEKTEADLVSIEFKAERKLVKIERRGTGADSYWWGSDTLIDRKPKAKPPGAGSGSDAGSAAAGSDAGSGSGSGSAAQEMEEKRTTKEFPIGEGSDRLFPALITAHALRDLGTPSDDQKKEFKLLDSKSTLTITFKDGARTFVVGGAPFGAGDRYVLDQSTGKAYVISKDMIASLDTGESALRLNDPHGFDATKVGQVTIEADGKSKSVTRIQTGVEGQQVKTWGDPATQKADQTIANFIDNSNALRPVEFHPEIQVASLTLIVTLSYRDEKGRPLGTMQVYKREVPPTLPPGQTPDPANPPKPVVEYYQMTEKTRVPALLRKEVAERTEQDVPTVLGDHPLELPGKPVVGPHGSFKPGSGGPLPPVPTSPATPAPGAPPGPATPAPATPAPTTPAPAPAAPKAAPPAPVPAAPAAPAHP